jgi:hypothetical protein
MGSFEPIVEEPKEEKSAEMSNDPTILIEDHIQPTPFVRPIQRRNFGRPKSTRPLSENIGYNEDLLEKLEEPALRRIMSLGPEERFKRSSLRYTFKSTAATLISFFGNIRNFFNSNKVYENFHTEKV